MEDFENEFFEDKPKAQTKSASGKTAAVAILAAVVGVAIGFAGALFMSNGTISADIFQSTATKTPCSCASPIKTKSPTYNRSVTPVGSPSVISSAVASPSVVPVSSAIVTGSSVPAPSPATTL